MQRLLAPCDAELLRVQQGLEEAAEEALKQRSCEELQEGETYRK